jgi:hypothetical protein
MPRPRVHAHLTIEAIEKEIARHTRAGQRYVAQAIIDLCAHNKIPLSTARINDYVAQLTFPGMEIEDDGMSESAMQPPAQNAQS